MTRRGRPPVGVKVETRLDPKVVAALDAVADGNRAGLIRRILTDWADSR